MKYKHNMQKLQNDCGVSVIQTILEQNKLSHLKKEINLSLPDEGLSLQGIVDTFKKIGINAVPYEVEDTKSIKEVSFPCIALVSESSFTHYVVVHNFDKRNKEFIISNPSEVDIYKISEDKFYKVFLGFIILVDKLTTHTEKSDTHEKNIIDTYKSIISSISHKNKIELIVLIFLQFLLPLIFYQLLQGTIAEDFEHINKYTSTIYFIFYLSFFIGTYFLGIRFAELKLELENTFQKKIMDDYYFSNMEGVREHKNVDNMIGYLSTIMQGASGLIERFFLTFDILFAIFLVTLMFFLHPLFPVIFLGISSIYAFYTHTQLKKIMNFQQNLTITYNKLLSKFEANILGSLDIKVYEKESEAYSDISKSQKGFFTAKYLDAILQNKLSVLSSISTFSMIISILLVTFISLRLSGNILYPLSSGLYVFFVVISLIESVTQSFLSYKMSYVNIEYVQGIKDFLNKEIKTNADKIIIPRINNLELKNLTFGYNESIILKNIELSLTKGTCTSISGENGTGKTTLTKILLGILNPNKGTIIIDHIELATLSRTDVLSQINYYSPEQHLFYGTVSNNVSMDIFEENSHEEYKSIFSNAIQSNTIIQQGGINISQGQKQKILLDRCFYVDKNIYILDEPTGNLDKNSKKELITKILKLKDEGKIILLVSHDNDLLKICDTKLELIEGKVYPT